MKESPWLGPRMDLLTANQQILNVVEGSIHMRSVQLFVCCLPVLLTWILDPLRPFLLSWHWRMCSSLFPEYKRSRHEIKKKSSDTMKLQKKARKGNTPPTVGRRRQMFLLYVIVLANWQHNQSALSDPGVFVCLSFGYGSTIIQHITFTEDLKQRQRERVLSFIHSSVKEQRRDTRLDILRVMLPSSGSNEYVKPPFTP